MAAYTFIPTRNLEIQEKILDENIRTDLIELLDFLHRINPNITDPISISEEKNHFVKILPEFLSTIDLKRKLEEFFNTKLDPSKPKKAILKNKLNIKFGSGSRGNRGVKNAGHLLELQIGNDIRTYLSGGSDFILPGFIEELSEIVDIDNIDSIEAEGKLNKLRKLKIRNGIPEVGVGNLNLGPTITDITLTMDNNQKKYLSIKKGNTVQFANIGVATLFPDREFHVGEFSRPEAKNLLTFFGIEEQKFISVFKNHLDYLNKGGNPRARGINRVVEVSDKIDFNKLQDFIYQLIGHGYIYCHLLGKNKWKIFEMTKSKMEQIGRIKRNSARVIYSSKESKKVELVIETEEMTIRIDLRNKMGGVFPKHMGCKYTFKKLFKEDRILKTLDKFILKRINESRYSLKNYDIIRLSDGLKGRIALEVAYGKSYKIEWENGKTQYLGTSTIKDKKRYELIAPKI